MKTGVLIVCFLLSLASCKKNERIPSDVLPLPKMQAVLWDIMRADKFLSDFAMRDTALNRKTESIKMYQQVFALHHINKEKFQQSFSWYQSHPSFLKVIMDSLNNRRSDAPTALAQPNDTTTPLVRSPGARDTTKAAKRKNPLRPE